MNRFFYSSLFYLATPLLILRLLWRALRAPAYLQRWPERFGFYGKNHDIVSIVFHAVSVGEVHAAEPLIRRLLGRNPALKVLVTTSTPTGSARVTALLGDKVGHVYLPYDYPGAVRRFLQAFSPQLLVIMETELWPNLIHTCRARGVRTLLGNARLSVKSRANYRKVAQLTAGMLQALDRVSAQSQKDSERLQMLGLPADKVLVTGSMKFDLEIDASLWEKARSDSAALQGRPVLVAASTRKAKGVAEESRVLAALEKILKVHHDLLLVLVPRHPERFDAVFELAEEGGFVTVRRSAALPVQQRHQILLGDTMGEMHYYLGLADIAFVGGSLVPTGCQNIIEPAAIGLPVVTGPSLFNFQAASEQFREAGGMQVVADEEELAAAVIALLGDDNKRQAMAQAARNVVNGNKGATSKNLELISELLQTAGH